MTEPALRLCAARSCPATCMALMPLWAASVYGDIKCFNNSSTNTNFPHAMIDYSYIGPASRSSIKSLVVGWKLTESAHGYHHKTL